MAPRLWFWYIGLVALFLKRVADVRQALANDIRDPKQLASYSIESMQIPEHVNEPNVPLITIPTSLSGGEVSIKNRTDAIGEGNLLIRSTTA
jgi:hypothetical protein